MPTDCRMTIDERRKYLRIRRTAYRQAGRSGRRRLLDEMEQVTGLDRKTLIRLMSGSLEREPRRQQRGRTYGHEVDDAIRVIQETLDYICAERLTPALASMAQHLADHNEMVVSPELLEKLQRISISTVGRILKRIEQDTPRLHRKPPTSLNRVATSIPMRVILWNEKQPGHIEIDLVHHCGSITSGEYVYTLQFIDVTTGWSERVAVLGRSYRVMQDAFRRIFARIPFPILELHPDNGSEFINDHLVRFLKDEIPHLFLSRSRPRHSNDNRFVEQKNDTLIRHFLGHQRFDTVAHTLAMNRLYDKMWVYYNLFQPVMRLRDKAHITDQNGASRVIRRFDTATTPFDRLCATSAITQERQEQLKRLRTQTNPRQLRNHIWQLVDHIVDLPLATPGETEDIFLTLTPSKYSQKGEGSPVTLSFDRTIALR
jgi:hypothetical protein